MKHIPDQDVDPCLTMTRSDRGLMWIRLDLGSQTYYLTTQDALDLADYLVDTAETFEKLKEKIREEEQ